MKVLVISAHSSIGHSMHRYTELAVQAWEAIGTDVRVVRPPDFISSRLADPGARKWVSYYEKFIHFSLRLRREAHKADLVHIIDHSDSLYAYMLPREKVVCTVHDLFAVRAALHEFPGYSVKWTGRVYQGLVRRALASSRLLMSDSQVTAADVERILNRKSEIVHLPVPALPRARPVNTTPFMLVVATDDWRKRRALALKVWLELSATDKFKDIDLVIIGNPLTRRERAVTSTASARVAVKTGISDADLASLYASATALLVLSSFEGFGWPVLEAQSFGCPVLCADIHILREVGGTGAIFVSGDEKDGWAEVAEKLADPTLRAAGRTNVARFSSEAFQQTFSEAVQSLRLD